MGSKHRKNKVITISKPEYVDQNPGHLSFVKDTWVSFCLAVLLLTIFQYCLVNAIGNVFTWTYYGSITICFSLFFSLILLGLWQLFQKHPSFFSFLLILPLLFLLYEWMSRSELNGTRIILGRIIPDYASYYHFPDPVNWTGKLTDQVFVEYRVGICISILLMISPWTTMVLYALNGKASPFLAALACGFPIVLALGSGQMVSIEWSVALLLLALILMYLSREYKMYASYTLTSVLGSSGIIACFCIAYFISGRWTYGHVRGYLEPVQDYLYQSGMESVVEDFKEYLQGPNSGGIAKGDLSSTGNLKPSNRVCMTITSEKNINETIYLKGFIGTTYDGKKWIGSEKDPILKENLSGDNISSWVSPEYHFMSKYQSWFTETLSKYELNIKYSIYEKNRLYPYRSLENEIGDSFLYCESPNEYSFYQSAPDFETMIWQYRNLHSSAPLSDWHINIEGVGEDGSEYPVQTDGAGKHYVIIAGEMYLLDYVVGDYLTETQVSNEELYQNLTLIKEAAYRDYLQVPDSNQMLRNAVEKLIADRSDISDLSSVKDWSLAQKVVYVQNYLASLATYSLNPGKITGEDFVDSFLYDKKKGYCMHFATAGTIMFRLLGIPARYVEGYVVSPAQKTGKGTYEVTEKQAHAWVEIFIPGYGWREIEVTPGYNGNNDYGQEERSSEATSTVDTTTEASTQETTRAETSTEQMSSSEIKTTQKESTALETTLAVSETSNNSGPGRIISILCYFLFGVIIIVTLFIAVSWLRYYVIFGKRYRQMNVSDRSKAVWSIYREIMMISEAYGHPITYESEAQKLFELYFPKKSLEFTTYYQKTLEKALFGPEKVSEENYRMLYKGYQSMRNTILRQSSLKRRIWLVWVKHF